MRYYGKLSSVPIPPGTTPTISETKDRLVYNSYGGGYATLRVTIDNASISANYSIVDVITFGFKLTPSCDGCPIECQLDYGLAQCDCLTTAQEEIRIVGLSESVNCSQCTGFVCIVEESEDTYLIKSRHEGHYLEFYSSLVLGRDYTVEVVEDIVPLGLQTNIPVGVVVVQDPTSEFYNYNHAHLPQGNPDEVFVGITKAGEIGLLNYGDTNLKCECPYYSPCKPMCVLVKGKIVVRIANRMTSSLNVVGYINDLTSPDNGRLVLVDGSPLPNTASIEPLPNAKLINGTIGGDLIEIELS